MGRHRLSATTNRVDEGRRAAVVIGVVGVLVVGMVLGVWWFLASGSGFRTPKATAYATVGQSGQPGGSGDLVAAAVPTTSFVVPTPTFITPSLTAPLGTLEPPLPPDVTNAPVQVTAKPVASPPPPPAPSSTSVSRVALTCALQGSKVRATVSFTGSGTIAVSVTAGTVTVNDKLSGPYRLSATDDRAGRSSTCSAVVNGVQYGPTPAR